MKAVVEFVGYFRLKAGCEDIEVEVGDDPTVLELVKTVEKKLEERDFSVLEEDRLKNGVLLFRPNERGGLERCGLDERLSLAGKRIVMANLMGGG